MVQCRLRRSFIGIASSARNEAGISDDERCRPHASKVAASPGSDLGDALILSCHSNQTPIDSLPLILELMCAAMDWQAAQLLLQSIDAEAHSSLLRRSSINSVH